MYVMLIARNVTAHASTPSDLKAKASPSKITRTPLIIGLRTCRYTPTTTSRRGGSHGASVPRPTVAKCHTVTHTSVSPNAMITVPLKSAAALAGFAISQTGRDEGRERTIV